MACRTVKSELPYSSILGSLMTVVGVLDREFVQVKFPLHLLELARRRLEHGDPDETIRAFDVRGKPETIRAE